MSIYWKQSLIIGGIYWIISLFLGWNNSMAALLIDFGLSLFLLIMLLPMNKMVPIKRLDSLMNNHPMAATWLASVGWVPYFSAMVAVIASIAALIWKADVNSEVLENIISVVVVVGFGKNLVAAVVVFAVTIALLVYGKSIAGQLDDNYNLTVQSESMPKKAKAKTKISKKKTTSGKKNAK